MGEVSGPGNVSLQVGHYAVHGIILTFLRHILNFFLNSSTLVLTRIARSGKYC